MEGLTESRQDVFMANAICPWPSPAVLAGEACDVDALHPGDLLLTAASSAESHKKRSPCGSTPQRLAAWTSGHIASITLSFLTAGAQVRPFGTK